MSARGCATSPHLPRAARAPHCSRSGTTGSGASVKSRPATLLPKHRRRFVTQRTENNASMDSNNPWVTSTWGYNRRGSFYNSILGEVHPRGVIVENAYVTVMQRGKHTNRNQSAATIWAGNGGWWCGVGEDRPGELVRPGKAPVFVYSIRVPTLSSYLSLFVDGR